VRAHTWLRRSIWTIQRASSPAKRMPNGMTSVDSRAVHRFMQSVAILSLSNSFMDGSLSSCHGRPTSGHFVVPTEVTGGSVCRPFHSVDKVALLRHLNPQCQFSHVRVEIYLNHLLPSIFWCTALTYRDKIQNLVFRILRTTWQ